MGIYYGADLTYGFRIKNPSIKVDEVPEEIADEMYGEYLDDPSEFFEALYHVYDNIQHVNPDAMGGNSAYIIVGVNVDAASQTEVKQVGFTDFVEAKRKWRQAEAERMLENVFGNCEIEKGFHLTATVS